jgi:nucleoside-diphosphate-sugar epimerase
MKIVVTGAGGFIGSRLVPYLKQKGHEPVTLSRSGLSAPNASLEGAGAVIHLAGIAHTGGTAIEDYMRVNCDLAVDLAATAHECGVERFVFVSSSHAQSHPETPYGSSKAEAERRLLACCKQEVVIMRPTLVYGLNAKGNFSALVRLAAKPVPLPFGAATAKRSMVYIENLIDALTFAAEHPNISGRTFTVTDSGPGLSLAQTIELLRKGAGRPGMLFAARWLPSVLGRFGAGNMAEKLFGESVFDGEDLFAEGWIPPFSSQDALMFIGHSQCRT